jgi:dihydroorotate dehydrogenase
MKTLIELNQFYLENPLPINIQEIIKENIGIDLTTHYADFSLKNPILVAPGQLTVNSSQIQKIYKAGYSGCVLKSVVGESENSQCSMTGLRKKEDFIKTFYEKEDKEGEYPIIHWNGRLDTRNLNEYMQFIKEVNNLNLSNFAIIGSFVCHLPKYEEDFNEKEWLYTLKKFDDAGYKILEIDFCPYLRQDNYWSTKEDILRWYRKIPEIIKTYFPKIKIYPKIININFGMDFQIEMAKETIKGGSDGLVIGNRIYKEEYNSGHGGEELRLTNLQQIKKIKELFPDIEISATGGIYSGKHVLEYLKAGAANVQLLSYIMGKVKKPFIKKGNKFEQVFYKILFDIKDGLIPCMLKDGYNNIKEVGLS